MRLLYRVFCYFSIDFGDKVVKFIDIDDDLLEKVKEKNLSLSKVVKEALRGWFKKEVSAEDFDILEKTLYKKMTKEGEKAWSELKGERDRW